MAWRSLKCLLRELNQNTDSLGRRDAKPFNLPLKESAVTSETHWSKPVTPPPPTHPKPSLPATSSPPPAVQIYQHPFSPTDTYLFLNDGVFGYRIYQPHYRQIIPGDTMLPPPSGKAPVPGLTLLSKPMEVTRERQYFSS